MELTVNQSAILEQNVFDIKRLGKRAVEDVIQIGKLLTECKAILSYGDWEPWLEKEFGWGNTTALNFMRVHEMIRRNANFADLNLSVSSLYLLASPSTPEKTREEIIEKAKVEKVTHKDVKQTIERDRPKKVVSKPAVATQTKEEIKIEGSPERNEAASVIINPIKSEETNKLEYDWETDERTIKLKADLEEANQDFENLNSQGCMKCRKLETELATAHRKVGVLDDIRTVLGEDEYDQLMGMVQERLGNKGKKARRG